MTTDTTTPLDAETEAALVELVIRGMHRGPLSLAQQTLVTTDLAMVKGPMLMPTATGTGAAQALCRLPTGGEIETSLLPMFERFLPVNRRLRDVCTAWQLRPDGTSNDHTHAGYDASVRDQLDDVDEAIGRIIRRMAAVVPNLEHYRADLTASLEAFDAGDSSGLTSPLSDSYHTVWMRLHQQLLLLLGISRAEDERLENELVAGQKVC